MRYSLIIPHHGSHEMLQRLLDTVPKRNDLEVLVINDDDQRGAGWARNKGIESANGEYFVFADSDDWFLPAFNDLLDELSQETADIIFFNATSVEEGTGKPSWRTDRLNWIFKHSGERREFLLRHTFTEPWCHIIRKSIIEKYNLRFDETSILNDVTFTTQCGYYAETCSMRDVKAYCVCNRKGSTAKQQSADRMVAYTKVMARTNVFNLQHGVNFYFARMMRPMIYCLLTCRLDTAIECYHAIRNAGYSTREIGRLLFTYPVHVAKWLYERRCYRSARECHTGE